jgi:arylsulfatase A-like enzyme
MRLFGGLIPVCLMLLSLAGDRVEAQGPSRPKRPNVLFLLSDDQRFDTIHALGNDLIQTPNLDRLAQRGFVFTNNYVMGSMHPAVCYPSRAMLMSGRTLWHTPVTLEGVPIWPETMRKAGYATFGTGKWHNGPASYARGFGQGGAIFFGGMEDHYNVPIADFDPTGRYPKQKRHVVNKFSSELFADTAIEFLRNYRGEEPFFLYLAFTAPHDPRTPPGEYARLYDPQKLPLPKNFLPEHPFDNGELRIRDEMLAPFPRTPEAVREHLAAYYGMISHLDAQIGRVLKTLEETGHAKDTIILFSSDNGLAVGQHGLLGKQNLYEHSTRMPLILAGPGIAPGKSDALVYLYDLFPTVCQLTGLDAPAGVEGHSLVPIVRGKQSKVRDHVLCAYREVQRMVREPRWKLIKYNVNGQKQAQLFDLQEDPWETRNLVDDPACQVHRQRLETLLEKARREASDPVGAKEGELGEY